ncbi:uncharacterized protein TRIADDRAFT_22637, partial [Trichoplax adhaerens]
LPITYIDGFHDIEAVRKMEYRRLGNTDMDVSVIGFGGAALSSFYSRISDNDGIELVEYAIKQGINFIDTAPWYGYGRSESLLGKVLPNIPRDAYYIATKVGRYEPSTDRMFDFSAKKIFASVDNSLRTMKLDYLDILQVHDLEFAPSVDQIINETLPALKMIKDSGKVRYIGITGYPLNILKNVAENAKIDTILSYCRYCLFDTSLKNYMDFFESCGLGVINAAPIGMGLLSQSGPPEWHPATTEIKDACRKAVNYCNKIGVDICKLAVRSCIDCKRLATTVISSTNIDILKSNLTTAHEPLTQAELRALKYIKNKYFQDLKSNDWEGFEVAKYRRQLNGH